MPQRPRGGTIFDLQESYATLQGTITVLRDLALPEKVKECLHWVKVWCDEWEDLGIPRSQALNHLTGDQFELKRFSLIQAMDKASEMLTSEEGTLCV